MPTIKDFLKIPLVLPKSIEASLPSGSPQIASILGSFVDGLPAGPEIPAVAGLPTSALQLPRVPMVTEFIKSIEGSLPIGLPKLTQDTASADETVAPAPIKAPKLIFE